jgi:hypothetical protein
LFKNINIWVDSEEIGIIPSLKVGSKEYSFILNDGSKLEIRLVNLNKILPSVQLEILLNNQSEPSPQFFQHLPKLIPYNSANMVF